MAARRLSVSSMNSLVSIDIQTPSQEWAPSTLTTLFGQHLATTNGGDDLAQPCGQLGADLLDMLEEDGDLADTRLLAADGHELLAHSCILWASGSEFFKVHNSKNFLNFKLRNKEEREKSLRNIKKLIEYISILKQ
jgi:hypothetical protein